MEKRNYPFSLRQEELNEWQSKNFPTTIYDNLDREALIARIHILEDSIGMAEEVGELCHVILKASQKVRTGASGKIDKDLVADGFADMVIFGTQLMTKLGINAEEAIEKTIKEVLNRDWTKDRSEPTRVDFNV